MSQATEPVKLVRLFFEHLQGTIDLKRALVLSSAGLAPPQYRVVHNVDSRGDSIGSASTGAELREGGLLASMLYLAEVRSIDRFTPEITDPAFDLLAGSRSLVAFPLFQRGSIAGLVVFLGSAHRQHDAAELCALATTSSLLGRAIEAQELAGQLETSCRALDSELQAAADVQRWLLPPLMLPSARASVAASYQTARRSGGDYYDVGELPDGRVGVFVADVSGKGAAAAVLMAVLRTIVHDEVDRSRVTGPAALLDYADARLCALGLPGRGAFITAFSGALDTGTGHFTFASAGHNPPRLLRTRERVVVPLDAARTVPLGLLEERRAHAEETVILTPGDLVLLYTDGITEARSSAGEFFGTARLDHVLRDLPGHVTPKRIVEAVMQAISNFASAGPPSDDQTLLALALRPEPGPAGPDLDP